MGYNRKKYSFGVQQTWVLILGLLLGNPGQLISPNLGFLIFKWENIENVLDF